MQNNSLWNQYNDKKYVSLSFRFNQEVKIMEGKDTIEIQTSVIGAAKLEFMSGTVEAVSNILLRAVNNRTRERNYANLCLSLSEGEITEEEFENEIINNENRYVISYQEETSPEEILIASQLSQKVLDVDTEDDFRELFSINSLSLSNFSKAIESK